jgi:hypothetical protein
MALKEELNEMFDALERTTPVTDAPFEEPVVETPVEKPVEQPAPATEPPKEELPKEEVVEKPVETPPANTELESIKKENEELRIKLADKAVVKEEPKPKTPTTDPPIEEKDFVGDGDFDELTRDPSTFNKLLNKIYTQAVQSVRGEVKKSKEETIQVLPSIINSNMELQKTLKEMSDNFYEENKDLKPFKKVVGVVFEELANQSPQTPYNEVLRKVGEETRKRLELKPIESKAVIKDKDDPPPLPRAKSGGRSPQPKNESNPVISQIDEMNKTLNR